MLSGTASETNFLLQLQTTLVTFVFAPSNERTKLFARTLIQPLAVPQLDQLRSTLNACTRAIRNFQEFRRTVTPVSGVCGMIFPSANRGVLSLLGPMLP